MCSIAGIGILGKTNEPLFIKRFNFDKNIEDSNKSIQNDLELYFSIHSSLDFVEEKANMQSDFYLGKLSNSFDGRHM